MIIDIHTHIFPEAIAPKAIYKLAKNCGIAALTDGTAAGVVARAAEWGIDHSICLPVATKANQTPDIIEFAAKINQQYPQLTCFAGIFPQAKDMPQMIEKAVRFGLKGIKIHPQYQEIYMDDPCIFELMRIATEYSLPVVYHAGKDLGLMHMPTFGAPDCTARLMDKLESAGITDYKLCAAHLGGFDCWDDVEKYLVGRNIYLDTSFIAGYIPDEQARRIILNHGTDKILFGSDCPWQNGQDTAAYVRSLQLGDAAERLIFSENVKKLLPYNNIVF